MAVKTGPIGGLIAGLVILAAGAAGAEEIAGIAEVRSGNEIAVGGKIVRLYGVAAPLPDTSCDFGEGKFQCGIIAWAELVRLADGRMLSCDVERTPARGEVYATCYVGEHDINEALVRSGWAEVSADAERYRVDQDDARRNRRGIWAGRVRPPDRRQAP